MKHILLIEDETDHADLIKRALATATPLYKVSHVANLAAGRASGRAGVAGSGAGGLSPARWQRRRICRAGRRIVFPVILLTAFGNERTAVEAIKAGALDYVIKSPETFANMAHLVERSLREWKNLHERRQAESRLEAVNHLLATMGPNFAENVSRLVTLLAREIGAQFAFYSQVSGQRLRTVAEWHVGKHLAACRAVQLRRLRGDAQLRRRPSAANQRGPRQSAGRRHQPCAFRKRTRMSATSSNASSSRSVFCAFFSTGLTSPPRPTAGCWAFSPPRSGRGKPQAHR